jgi:predicted aspartyl protease
MLALGTARAENIQGHADAADRLTVETMIGRAGPYRFLIDTGADRTVVSDDVAAALGLPAGGAVIVQGITSSAPAATARLPGLSFGSIALPAMTAPVLSRSALGADGYLGLDAIDGRRVTFDFARHSLSVAEGGPTWSDIARRPGETLVRAAGRAGKLAAVDCAVDGARATAFVDSGAEVSVANSRLFAALNKPYLTDAPIVLTGVTGGSAQGRLAAVDQVTLGALDFADGVLVVSDLPIFEVWGLANRPALLLGMNFLRQAAALTIDYRRKELLFRLAELRVASRA